jgi:hypothetical protein
MAAKLINVTLDKPRQIAFTQRALYRMATLPTPFAIEDVGTPKRGFGALVAWLWAMLGPDDAPVFPRPEDLAEHVPMDAEARAVLIGAFAEALNASAGEAKNGHGSTRRPSPASSSGSPRRSSGG